VQIEEKVRFFNNSECIFQAKISTANKQTNEREREGIKIDKRNSKQVNQNEERSKASTQSWKLIESEFPYADGRFYLE